MIKQTQETSDARVTVFDVDGTPYMVVQGGESGVPTFMVFRAEYGMGDSGDGESGPMPYQFLGPWQEVASGVGGSPVAKEVLASCIGYEERGGVEKALEEIRQFDAGQFEDLLAGLTKMALDAEEESLDPAWKDARAKLELARTAVQKRRGN